MSRIKTQNAKKCLSILETFVDGTSSQANQKRIAILAVHQLQKIMAGDDPDFLSCNARPMIDYNP